MLKMHMLACIYLTNSMPHDIQVIPDIDVALHMPHSIVNLRIVFVIRMASRS